MRWFISYRLVECNFVTQEVGTITYRSIITNVTPAQWVREHTAEHHIQYAEKISPALASELVHGGAGVQAEYFDNEV